MELDDFLNVGEYLRLKEPRFSHTLSLPFCYTFSKSMFIELYNRIKIHH